MSKKRLFHGMKRSLALFLALALALAFVPVVTPTALATGEVVTVSNSNLTGRIATQDLSSYTFVAGQLADSTGVDNAANNTNTLNVWNTIKTGATASFTVNYSADSGSTSAATLAFKVEAPSGSNAKLLIYDNPGGDTYVGGIWNVLNNKSFPDSISNANLIAALGANYDGYWGPVLGKDLSTGFKGYTEGDDYTYYFFADQVGTYTITAALLDISEGATKAATPLDSKTVTIEVLPVEIALTTVESTKVVSLDAFDALNGIASIKTAERETATNGEKLYSILGNVIKDVRDIAGVVAISYGLDVADRFTVDEYENTRINVTLTGGEEKAYLLATNCEKGSNSDVCSESDDCATYELIKTGFMGVWDGQDASDFNTVSSLTFFATAAGDYKVTLDLVDVNNSGAVLATGSFTINVAAAPVLNKTVSIGDISAAITAGTASTVTYLVTTKDIDDGTIGEINWYEDAATTTSFSVPSPTGLTATLTSLNDNEDTLKLTATTAVVAGTYYFTVTYDGVESAVKTLTVVAAPSTSANVTTADELKAAIDTKKTTINVTTSFPTTENVTIPVGTTLNIATDTSLTVADADTMTMYGTLALAKNAKVTIQGALSLSVGTLNSLTAGSGAGFVFDGGTLTLVPNPETTLKLAGLFADADFDLGLYAGAVLSLSGYTDANFAALLLLSSGTGSIKIAEGICGVVDNDATLETGLTLDVLDGAALQVKSELTVNGGLTVNGTVEVSATGTLTVDSNVDVTVNGIVTAESGATVSLQSNITIAAGGSLDLSDVTDGNVSIGSITIILAPGAELSVPAAGTYSKLTVMDEYNNVINSENGKYSVPEVPEYELTITSATGVGLGVSFKINVSAGSDSNDLYLIVQSTDEAVSLTMIAVGDYIAAGSGYTTHVSYNKTNQVDAWLVKSPTSGVVPDWTAVDTDGCLADDTYTATTP